jgi:hypothetical protein
LPPPLGTFWVYWATPEPLPRLDDAVAPAVAGTINTNDATQQTARKRADMTTPFFALSRLSDG